MPKRMIIIGDARAIWAAMEIPPLWRTIDELELTTAVPADDIADYLSVLLTHGYVELMNLHRAGSGEALPTFCLVNHTGPEAPYLDENGRLVDPNLPKPTARRGQSDGSLIARVRNEIRGWGVITLEKLVNELGDESRGRVSRVLNDLVKSGEVIRQGDEYIVNLNFTDPMGVALRAFFITSAGREVLMAEFAEIYGHMPKGGKIVTVLKALEREGYKITRHTRGRMHLTHYTVTAPEKAQ